jgi:anti-sigma B factor antagonist
MDFELSTSNPAKGIVGVVVVGELDLVTAPELKLRLQEVIGAGARKVLVDLSAVTFLDSTTLGVLVGMIKRLSELGGALAIVCDSRNILTIFEITNLDTVLNICSSTDEAVTLLQDLENDAARDGLAAPI